MTIGPSLVYAAHSGYGNQVQALLTALFLSHATRLPLLVPPLVGDHSLTLRIPKRYLTRRCDRNSSCPRATA